VDGLRFIALFSVVVIMHVSNFIDRKFFNAQWIPDGYPSAFVLNGGTGVCLFFVISGFILSLPFARWRLNGAPAVSIKQYYLRRLIRLEPPYLIALIFLFAVHVWILKTYSFSELFPHLLASAVYLHTIIYEAFPLVLPVAWTLEVEVQFYVLAPLFFSVFLLRNEWLRRSILIITILVSAYYFYNVWELGHVFMYLHYFAMGLLLADLYCTDTVLIKNETLNTFAGLISLLAFLGLDGLSSMAGSMAKLGAMFLLFHSALTSRRFKQNLSHPVLTSIGGMCYSVYLWHFAVISAIGIILLKTGWNLQRPALIPALYVLLIAGVLLFSALYFLWVEKPFMKLRVTKTSEHKKAPVLE
jgi:peptidoglycan/LPS O-acetylase OafA/YrhL